MTTRLIAHRKWGMIRDSRGHLEYKITYLVEADRLDGPTLVLQTAGLPTPGSFWDVDNDTNVWAFCQWETQVEQVLTENEPNTHWEVTFTYSTKPWAFCRDASFEDPLLEPAKVSGSFIKDKIEVTHDRHYRPITYSSHEPIRGPKIEFDLSRWQVRVEQNVIDLQLPTISAMKDTVNAFDLWGFGPRCIRLADCTWDPQYYGLCYIYYKRILIFEIDEETWDRDILDEGDKVLKGHWDTDHNWILDNIAGAPPDPDDPTHFITAVDFHGNPCHVILNGAGVPATQTTILGAQYVAIQDNTNQSVENTTYWVPTYFVEGMNIEDWQLDTDYSQGRIVLWNGPGAFHYYVALSDNINEPPDTSTSIWEDLGTVLPRLRGNWNSSTSYVIGDIVYGVPGTTSSEIGSIPVEYYPESDFLFLGIPTTL